MICLRFVCCVFFVDCLPLVLHFYGPSLSRSVPGNGGTFLRLEFIRQQKTMLKRKYTPGGGII